MPTSSSSHMRFMSHNWSATKQRLHPQSVAEISRHSVLSADRIRQCETLPTDQGSQLYGFPIFAADAMQAQPMVTFVNFVITSKPLGSHIILVFPYQLLWDPSWSVECRWGQLKLRFWANSWLSIDDCWPRISESIFITTSIVDHGEEKRRELNSMQL